MFDPDLRKDISRKQAYLEDKLEKCDFALAVHGQILDALNSEANNHSLRIEIPKSQLYKQISAKERLDIARHIKDCQENVRAAWLWGKSEYEKANLCDELVIGLASRIEPDFIHSYRRDAVRISGSHLIPPRPEKVPSEMANMFEESKQLPVLEQALYLHLNTARIHPFSDGNGRTSRMLQNLTLTSSGLPPVIIYEGERAHYLDLIQDAVRGNKYRDEDEAGISDSEKRFYTFLATKVNIAFDKILDRLEGD